MLAGTLPAWAEVYNLADGDCEFWESVGSQVPSMRRGRKQAIHNSLGIWTMQRYLEGFHIVTNIVDADAPLTVRHPSGRS